MSATIFLRDIVRVGVDIFLVRIIPLQGNFYGYAIFYALRIEVEYLVYRSFVGIQIVYECLQPTFILEQLTFPRALILQLNRHSGIQEGEFAKLLCKNFVVELNVREGFL